jgi:hypothetical protein
MRNRVPSQLQDRLSGNAGNTDDPGVLLQAILQGFPPSDFVDAKVGPVPSGFQEEPALGEIGKNWLYITVRARDEGAGKPYARWEAQLVAGAFRQTSHEAGLPELLGSTTTVLLPNGATEAPVSAVIAAPLGQPAISQSEAHARIRARIAKDSRLGRSILAFVRGLDAAPVVTTTLSNAAAFRPAESVATALFGLNNDYEGTFVTVLGPDGQALRANGFAGRTGIGFSWSPPAAGSDTINPGPVAEGP